MNINPAFYYRNAFLANKGFATPKTTKTGTTICGAIFEGGVVVGADTRSTSGEIVADKNCMKIHELAPNMVRMRYVSIKFIEKLKTDEFSSPSYYFLPLLKTSNSLVI